MSAQSTTTNTTWNSTTTGPITYPGANWMPDYIIPYGESPIKKPRATLRSDEVDMEFELKDGMRTTLPFKDYMNFVLVHHKLPEECKDLAELGELVKEMKMIDEL